MSSLDEMLQRLEIAGGDQDGRNVKGKLLSFRSALKNSYQAEWIEFNNEIYRCLINPDKLRESFDHKEISIDYDAGLKNGDYIFWPFRFFNLENGELQRARIKKNILDDENESKGTHWIVYMQDFAEEAYFRGSIRRCDHTIMVNDTLYWIYLTGPSQMEIELGKHGGIEIAGMSYILHLYIQDNPETRAFFERLKIVKFDGHNWRITAVDRYTQKGVITVYLEEYRDNPEEDAMIVPEIIEPSKEDPYIEGPQSIKYNKEYTYSIVGDVTGGVFKAVKANGETDFTKVNIVSQTDSSCVLKIPKMVSFREYFDLIYVTNDTELRLNILMTPM